MKRHLPRILITAERSGSGKTTAVCGLLALLKRKGLVPAALKIGPDYIDPMFHRAVLGIPTGNLDTFFTEPEPARSILLADTEGADANCDLPPEPEPIPVEFELMGDVPYIPEEADG